ncbi:MAG: hypothetical protein DME23_12155 [Verrucomicrobia bacterium]|nr:MAG: hypothetical protein DME23_12155 [Verrucomicrobiota bacterium]
MKTTHANSYCKLAHLFCALGLLALFPRAHADVISDWNDTAIRVIKSVNPNPIFASRSLAMTHVAQFDAVNAVVGCYEPYAAHLSAPGASAEAAAAQAAYHVLVNLYPSQLFTLDAALAGSLSAMPDGTAKTDGIALGNEAAGVILALRANDGSTATVRYTPGSGPGVWVPTPPAFAPAVLPQWRYVTPWTMTAPEQFRPGPPLALESASYTADFNEIKALGALNSSTRTPEQTDIALFHNSEAPGFTLSSAARFAVAAHPLRLVDSARLFALLNMAVADALISVWDAKFTYNFWRPVTAIRAADTDGNPATDPDPAWLPLAATPPHPEYPAAHTIISAAGATVLASVFGDEFTFTISSPALPGKPRTYARFSDFPGESSLARIAAGFHWRNSTVVAGKMGAAIGRQALAKYLRDIEPPTIIGVVPSVKELWPPNHRLVPVTVAVIATDNCDPAPTAEIIEVTSSEALTGRGDFAASDWEITGPLSVNLRSERSPIGSGRVYTLTVRCTDAFGNSSVECVRVICPHDQRGRRNKAKL